MLKVYFGSVFLCVVCVRLAMILTHLDFRGSPCPTERCHPQRFSVTGFKALDHTEHRHHPHKQSPTRTLPPNTVPRAIGRRAVLAQVPITRCAGERRLCQQKWSVGVGGLVCSTFYETLGLRTRRRFLARREGSAAAVLLQGL